MGLLKRPHTTLSPSADNLGPSPCHHSHHCSVTGSDEADPSFQSQAKSNQHRMQALKTVFIGSSACVVQVDSVLASPLTPSPACVAPRVSSSFVRRAVAFLSKIIQIMLKSEVITKAVSDICTSGNELLKGMQVALCISVHPRGEVHRYHLAAVG